eukprot:sb/3463335/
MIRGTVLLLLCISTLWFQQVAAEKEESNETSVEGVADVEEEPDPTDEEDLKPYLLEISVVPTTEEIIEIANDTEKFDATYEEKLRRAYEKATMGLHNLPAAIVVVRGNHTTLTEVSDNRENIQHISFKRQCCVFSQNSYSEQGALLSPPVRAARELWSEHWPDSSPLREIISRAAHWHPASAQTARANAPRVAILLSLTHWLHSDWLLSITSPKPHVKSRRALLSCSLSLTSCILIGCYLSHVRSPRLSLGTRTYHVIFHVTRCCDPGPRLTKQNKSYFGKQSAPVAYSSKRLRNYSARANLITLTDEETKSATITFYVKRPPVGMLKGSDVQKSFKILSRTGLWDTIGGKVETLGYPVALMDSTTTEKPQSRTFSIVAFVMGWMCLAALIVILAYLGIKYRDGIKSLAKRIERWSNPNRNGYENVGGDVHSASDWRNDTDAILRDNPSPTEDSKPKKKLRAPGGLLTDLEQGKVADKPSAHQSYGSAEANTATVGNSTQIRLSDLAGPEQQQGDGAKTPPMTPTSMQRHLIKKYQDKQVEEHRTKAAEDTDHLAATGSEVFPDDFADCVEEGEEEIFHVNP